MSAPDRAILSNADHVRRAFEMAGPAEILINNAATVEGDGFLHELGGENWDYIRAVRLKSVFLCSYCRAGYYGGAACRGHRQHQFGEVAGPSAVRQLRTTTPQKRTQGEEGIMKITAIETTPVSLVVRPDVAIVSAAGAHPESHYVVVTIRSDEGHAGYGEATVTAGWSGETLQSALHAIREVIAPHLIGQNPLHLTALAATMDRFLQVNSFTKAAVEMALLDLAGKELGVPAYMLLGGPRRGPEIRLRFSIGAFTAGDAAKVALAAIANGLRAVKVKVGLDRTGDIERVAAVRSAVGKDFRVAVDANCGWNESDTLWAIPHLERLGVNAIEQPLPRGDFRGCARLRKRTNIPIMLDESIFTRQDALQAIRHEACDLINIYPGKNGGVLRSLEIAQMAATAGLRCTIGSNLEMDLGTAAMLQLAIAMPALADEVDHDTIGPLYYDAHLTNPPIRYDAGCAIVPDGPGLGVAFDLQLAETAIARSASSSRSTPSPGSSGG